MGLTAAPREAEYESDEEFNAAEDAYWVQNDAIVYKPEHSVRLLYLSHLGCALRYRRWLDAADGLRLP
ncbi:hypothetical protein ACFPJ1_27180 [Kribbella qitaiheensis]|uniref:hypothetical protein n=1 Tax=Kribbella qitaiheensis TaxID=1544730 RepID=UPI0036168DB3